MVGTVLRIRSGIFIAAALLGAATVAAADTVNKQSVVIAPAIQDVAPGGVATVTLVYDATDKALPGLGLRLHYDSSKLQFDGSRLLFTASTMGHQDQPDAGSTYADQFDDGNPQTDRRFLAAWSDVTGGWPGEGATLPLSLLELRFRVKDGAAGNISLAMTGTACGSCVLDLGSATIQVVGGGLTQAPTATAVPPTPQPTTTPTPGPPDILGPPPDGGLTPYGAQPIGIPTLSEVGSVLLGALLAASAVAILLRRRG